MGFLKKVEPTLHVVGFLKKRKCTTHLLKCFYLNFPKISWQWENVGHLRAEPPPERKMLTSPLRCPTKTSEGDVGLNFIMLQYQNRDTPSLLGGVFDLSHVYNWQSLRQVPITRRGGCGTVQIFPIVYAWI